MTRTVTFTNEQITAYAPPDLAGKARTSVMEAWAALRPMLLRRVASRLRRSRA